MKDQTKYICECGKSFETQTTLSHHKTQCKVFQQNKRLKEQEDREKRRLPNGMFKCENPNCGKEHDGSYGSGRFCSKHCRCSASAKKVKHKSVPKINQRLPYGTWKCKKCNLIFETRKQLEQHNHKCHPIEKGSSWNKGLTKKDKRISNAVKKLKNGYKSGRLIPWNKGIPKTNSQKEKLRISTFKYLAKLKTITQPRYNVNSILYFDKLSKEKGWNLQHAENGGEITVLGYWLDAYDKQRNIVVEYDEPRHYEDVENNILKEKDIKRQQEIIDHLHCEFWRYNEKMDVLWKVA